jgi:hypothetical protein
MNAVARDQRPLRSSWIRFGPYSARRVAASALLNPSGLVPHVPGAPRREVARMGNPFDGRRRHDGFFQRTP